MTIEERAREIADIFLTPPMAIALQNSIAEALRTVRNEALEEAAKVAESLAREFGSPIGGQQYTESRPIGGQQYTESRGRAEFEQSERISKAIRSLKESP